MLVSDYLVVHGLQQVLVFLQNLILVLQNLGVGLVASLGASQQIFFLVSLYFLQILPLLLILDDSVLVTLVLFFELVQLCF